MSTKEITLIFPPTHDFSMSYLSLPVLKAHIEHYSDMTCRIADFNQKLFTELIGLDDLQLHKAKIKSALDSEDLVSALSTIFELEHFSLQKFAEFFNQSLGYGLSLRQCKVPYDIMNSGSVYEGVCSPSNPFYSVFYNFLNDGNYQDSRVFGISLAVEDQLFSAFTLARVIRDMYPEAHIVFGGTLLTRLADNIRSSQLAQFIDFMVLYEGEEPFLELLHYIFGNVHEITSSKIIDVRRDQRQATVREVGSDVDLITPIRILRRPVFDDLDLDAYWSPIKIIPIQITRRCYYDKCEFCAIYMSWDGRYRKRSIDAILDDIEHYASDGVKYYRIVDEDCSPQALREFTRKINERNLDIRFEAYTRFEKIFLDSDFCRQLFDAGCRQLFFGLENVGGQTSAMTKKGDFYTVDHIKTVLKNTADAGILNYCFVMIGIPNAPVQEERDTVSFIINEPNIHCIALDSYVLEMYSPMHEDPELHVKYDIQPFSQGDLTTMVGFLHRGRDISGEVRERAANFTDQIFKARPDLAITSLLNEESRFVLCDTFGNNFAKGALDYVPDHIVEKWILDGFEKSKKEKIDRSL